MIALAESLRTQVPSLGWRERFLDMLPQIRRYVRRAFAHLTEDAQEEAVAESVAKAYVAYFQLVEREKEDLAYPTVLARFAVSQTKAGRRVGGRSNTKDVLNFEARKRRGFSVEGLTCFDPEFGGWVDATIEDRRTPIPDQAAFRCDFPTWLSTQSPRNRDLVESLSNGHSTGEVAQRLGVSAARVSQLRREMAASWAAFHGEEDAA